MRIVYSWQLTKEELEGLLRRLSLGEGEGSPQEIVRQIVDDVRRRGDAAVIEQAKRLDGAELAPETLFVSQDEWAAARVDDELAAALAMAKENIEAFHREQLPRSWFRTGSDGTILGQRYVPLQRVGLYVPGGTAPLFSSVLMGAVPAKVAGVGEIIMATPVGREGKVHPAVLVAARLAGVDRILKVGGAQAIAALAWGTETIPRVDKIVGPGNIYVTLAKRMVFGQVGIDMLAGPSEILVIAEENADPTLIAADLLSQAEHDPAAAAVLITPSQSLGEKVAEEVRTQLAALPRREIAVKSLEKWGLVVICRDLEEAVELANQAAPEHLELAVSRPWELLGKIVHAGAVFLGQHSPEPLGDYVAGPNHVLPTNGAARYASPLGVEDFCRRSSVIACGKEGLIRLGPAAAAMARAEGLLAHARAVELRLEKKG
jgi:histidinol dehydrogenase